ncbi:4-hydroxybenzoyl-CoA thioesterase [Candidatus Marinamargulisbacteria bacterium SCGC AG-410-N11]|nr:4-hydroxybenzoyl-CoA thioesterase [Candidatus Marinamargulisbacteria bacterium SCGC AG-410-N11]
MISETPFTWKHRVYFGDTDAAGIVYHAQYLYWLEAARIELLDHLNCPYVDLQARQIGFIPTDINIKFFNPLRFSDRFCVSIYVQKIGLASLILSNDIHRDQDKICTASITLACLNEANWKPLKIPNDIRDAFLNPTL